MRSPFYISAAEPPVPRAQVGGHLRPPARLVKRAWLGCAGLLPWFSDAVGRPRCGREVVTAASVSIALSFFPFPHGTTENVEEPGPNS